MYLFFYLFFIHSYTDLVGLDAYRICQNSFSTIKWANWRISAKKEITIINTKHFHLSFFIGCFILPGHLQPFIVSGTVPSSASVAPLFRGLFTPYTTLASTSSNVSTATKAKNTTAVAFIVDVLGEKLFSTTSWAADWGTGWVSKSPVTSKQKIIIIIMYAMLHLMYGLAGL